MTVTGVNVVCAATFMAASGAPHRFMTARKLVAYLGLDPKVRQSADTPARSGRISKRGSAPARWALVEAAWSVARQPGPLHAFYEHTRAHHRTYAPPPRAATPSGDTNPAQTPTTSPKTSPQRP